MGLDLAALNLTPGQRLWHQAGLRYLFSDRHSDSPDSAGQSPLSPMASGEAGVFPEPWHSLWPRISKPCPTVWTYGALTDDLNDQDCSPQRRQLFKNILKSLGWPRGSVAFWPFAIRSGSQLQPFPDVFWQGLAEMAPRYLLCFGEAALEALCPQRPETGARFMLGQTTVIPLPEPDQLLPDNRDLKRVVWNTLSSIALKDPDLFRHPS